MGFDKELSEVKEFYYVSLARYGMSNHFLNDIKKRYPEVTDDKPFYISKDPPVENPPNYQFKLTTGEFVSLLSKHQDVLRGHCIILLVSLWELYSRKNKVKKYLNPEITEVILYRNCLVHNSGLIDRNYILISQLQKYNIGDKIIFSREEFEVFLSYFEGK